MISERAGTAVKGKPHCGKSANGARILRGHIRSCGRKEISYFEWVSSI